MTGQPPRIAADEIVALTSLRGIAALAVCFYHAEIGLAWTLREWYVRVNLYLWVDFFFILSGFVLMHVYGRALSAGGLASLRSFFAARFARVYPLHFVVLSAFVLLELLYLALASQGVNVLDRPLFRYYTDPSALPAHYLLIQSWGWFRDQAWNLPAWTISAELAAYLVFPLMVRWGLARGRVMHALLFVAAGAGISLIALHYGTLDGMGRRGVVRCLTEFTLGCLLYVYAPQLIAGLRQGLRRALEWPVALAVLLLMIPGAPEVWVAPTFCLAILLLIAPGSRLGTALQVRPLRRLGEISYSVYLIHTFVIGLIHTLLWMQRPAFLESPAAPPLLLLFVLLSVVLLADRTYHWVELPARRALRARLGA